MQKFMTLKARITIQMIETTTLVLALMKIRAKLEEDSKMSEKDIAEVFPLLEYPPKPSWGIIVIKWG
jgi:hypothetical protein